MAAPGLFNLLILRLLINFEFDERTTLHNLIFLGLTRVKTPGREEVISFIKTYDGVRSLFLDEMIDDLISLGLITDDLNVTEKGRESYYKLASLIKSQPLTRYCTEIMMDNYNDLSGIKEEINSFLPLRKKKRGEKVSLTEIWGVK